MNRGILSLRQARALSTSFPIRGRQARQARTIRACLAATCTVVFAWPSSSRGAPEGDGDDQAKANATAHFRAANALAKELRWAEALAEFERTAAEKPHVVVTYDIGVCHRALGQYTRAEKAFRAALREQERDEGTRLTPSVVDDTRAYLREIDGLLARPRVTVVPDATAIAIDGRPLEAALDEGQPVYVAGTRAPGPGEAAPRGPFVIALDPGLHVVVLSSPGFREVVVRRTFEPGEDTEVKWELARLPATLHVAADQSGAVVHVDGEDVGVAPVDVSRPAGRHHIAVRKTGFVQVESDVVVQPGERAELLANLKHEPTPLAKQPWFWATLGAVVAGVAATTYFVTRPEPTRAPLDGGSIGWVVDAR